MLPESFASHGTCFAAKFPLHQTALIVRFLGKQMSSEWNFEQCEGQNFHLGDRTGDTFTFSFCGHIVENHQPTALPTPAKSLPNLQSPALAPPNLQPPSFPRFEITPALSFLCAPAATGHILLIHGATHQLESIKTLTNQSKDELDRQFYHLTKRCQALRREMSSEFSLKCMRQRRHKLRNDEVKACLRNNWWSVDLELTRQSHEPSPRMLLRSAARVVASEGLGTHE